MQWCGFDRGLLCFFFGGVDGLGFFFFGVDGRLWVASGGGGVKCVQSIAVVVIVVLEQKERERKNK